MSVEQFYFFTVGKTWSERDKAEVYKAQLISKVGGIVNVIWQAPTDYNQERDALHAIEICRASHNYPIKEIGK